MLNAFALSFWHCVDITFIQFLKILFNQGIARRYDSSLSKAPKTITFKIYELLFFLNFLLKKKNVVDFFDLDEIVSTV